MELNSQSIVSIVRLAVSLVVTIAAVAGWSLDQELLFNIAISAVALFCLVYLLWWKNQPITKAAQEMQAILDAKKR